MQLILHSIFKIRIDSKRRRTCEKGKCVGGVLEDIAPKTSRGAYKIGTFLNVICLQITTAPGSARTTRNS
jgi:hypothetical protein